MSDWTDRAERIARTIETRPVLGHWPHMSAEQDAGDVRRLATQLAEADELIRQALWLLDKAQPPTLAFFDQEVIDEYHERELRFWDRFDARPESLMRAGAASSANEGR